MYENLASALTATRVDEAAARLKAGMSGAEGMPDYLNVKLTQVVV